LQGFIIGLLGAILGCSFALLFMRFRDVLMGFIVKIIAGEDGQVGVSQFYDFYSLQIYYPWESPESLNTFLSFACFAILVSTLAGLLPAWRATRLKPADSLRSE
jgi:lipoprotein-releasing system permease protein